MPKKPVFSTLVQKVSLPSNRIYVTLILICGLFGFAFYALTEATIQTTSNLSTPTEKPGLATTTSKTSGSKPMYQEQPLLFAGDVMLGRHVENLARANGTNYLTDFIVPYLPDNSAFIVNFESAMATPHTRTPSGGMSFSVATTLLPVLSELGVTHASLANNHGMDHGRAGYLGAWNNLKDRSIEPFGMVVGVGSSSVTYIPYGDDVIAIIGLHTLFHEPTVAELQEVMKIVSVSSTVQIAYVHWGTEYELTHSEAQERFAKLLSSVGIDLLIGHHPHVTQDIDIVAGMPVFYSLGNFIFDQYFSTEVKRGYLLSLAITDDAFNFMIYPHEQCTLSVPCFMSATNTTPYLEALGARSNPTLWSQIMAKKLVFPR